MNQTTFSLALFALVNIVAFLIMGWDKRQSRRTGTDRISEGLLFFMAIAFASIGVFLGMFVFRHKTQVWYFLLGIPLAALENLALLSLLTEISSGSARDPQTVDGSSVS